MKAYQFSVHGDLRRICADYREDASEVLNMVYTFALFYVWRADGSRGEWIGTRRCTYEEINAEIERLENDNPDKIFYYERFN